MEDFARQISERKGKGSMYQIMFQIKTGTTLLESISEENGTYLNSYGTTISKKL